MRTHVILAAALASLAASAQSQRILGWFQAGSNFAGYEVRIDGDAGHNGKGSGSIRCVQPKGCGGFGTLMQTFRADEFRGKRVLLSAWIKTVTAEHASIWMRVDTRDATAAFDNMDDRPISGTTEDWQQQSIVLNVPKDAATINYGVLLHGNGQAWVDDFGFLVVDKSVKTTDKMQGPAHLPNPLALDKIAAFPTAPVNTGFDQ